jgi:hypothetical protein
VPTRIDFEAPQTVNFCRSNNKSDNPNAQWHFVSAGVGKSRKDEYLILNVASGTYLTGGGT